MKTLRNMMILLILCTGSQTVNAQTSKEDKKAAKLAEIKSSVEAKRYTFVADYVIPQRGGSHQLTTEYDLRVTPDSVISYLPYFGRAYSDVGYGSSEGGIKFTSTKFEYSAKDKKKGGWEITITPKDAKNINRLVLTISTDGYASLSVNSINRDYISFNGHLSYKPQK